MTSDQSQYARVKAIMEKATEEILNEVEASKTECEAKLLGLWRSIDTAPLDGVSVIVWSPSTHTYPVVAAHHDEAMEQADLWYDEQGDPAEPTHWMPLPAPPAQDVSEPRQG